MEEERSEYYYRLVCLVVDLGTEVLLKVFKKYIPSGETIKTFLDRKSADVNRLKKRKILNDMHHSLIVNADEAKFDISLLYVLIRNLTNIPEPANRWDGACRLPHDWSAGACLNTLKTMRNKAVAHRAKAALRKSEFESFWKETEEALVELAGEISPEEKVAVQQKIVEAKSKPLLGNENAKLDALLKWDFEDKFSKMASKLDAMREQIAKQDVTEDMGSLKTSVLEIKGQLKNLGIHETPDAGTSSQLQLRRTVTDGGRQENSSELGQQVNNLQNMLEHFMKQYAAMILGVQADHTEPELPPITNPAALSNDEILEYSRELGSDWEIFAIYLGYKQAQIDALKNTYVRQIETLLRVMIEKWHDVVARCDDENPRKLLAAAFSGIRDNLTASKILGDRQLLKEVKNLKPQVTTDKKIKMIKFEVPQPRINLHVGGHNSINMFGNSSLSVGGQAAPIGPYPYQPYNNPQQMLQGAAPFGQYQYHPAYNIPQQFLQGGGAQGGHNQPYCRAEGVGSQHDGLNQTHPSNLFKKARDETLTQNDVYILNNFMKSVGYISTPYGNGTAFRVGDRFVITAFHLIEKVENDMYTLDRQNIDPGNPIPFVSVNFSERLDLPSQVVYRLHQPCFTDPGLDVAILEIVDPNSFLPRSLPLSKRGGPKSKVSIIGYGHPGTNLKHLDPNCAVLAANSDRVIRAINQVKLEIETIRQNLVNPEIVNTSFEGYDDPSRFLLDCFFEHGGSGGPAIDHEVPASTKVVGIYVKGFPSFFFDLPKHKQYQYRDVFRFEMCTRTSSLYSVLLASNEALTNNIFG